LTGLAGLGKLLGPHSSSSGPLSQSSQTLLKALQGKARLDNPQWGERRGRLFIKIHIKRNN
jgi:hypothetical protein